MQEVAPADAGQCAVGKIGPCLPVRSSAHVRMLYVRLPQRSDFSYSHAECISGMRLSGMRPLLRTIQTRIYLECKSCTLNPAKYCYGAGDDHKGLSQPYFHSLVSDAVNTVIYCTGDKYVSVSICVRAHFCTAYYCSASLSTYLSALLLNYKIRLAFCITCIFRRAVRRAVRRSKQAHNQHSWFGYKRHA